MSACKSCMMCEIVWGFVLRRTTSCLGCRDPSDATHNVLGSRHAQDTFIGRAAHIQFLECQPIMRMIIHNFSFLFR